MTTNEKCRHGAYLLLVCRACDAEALAVRQQVESDAADAIEGDDAPQFIGAASGELVVPGLAPAPGGMSEVHAFGRNANAAARAALCGDLGSTRGPADVVTCPNCRALLQAGSDATHAIEGTAPVPLYPKGTPEYDAYAAELKTELDKWVAGEEPYPYRPGHPLADREPAPPWRCPTCGSRQPSMHPAVSGGEVTRRCADPFHGAPVGVATWRPATEGETPGQCEPEHGPTQPITADDEPKWRVIITDSESLTGVAPVCDSPEHAKYAAAQSGDDQEIGADWVYDCCPHPQIECWDESTAERVAAVLTDAAAKACS